MQFSGFPTKPFMSQMNPPMSQMNPQMTQFRQFSSMMPPYNIGQNQINSINSLFSSIEMQWNPMTQSYQFIDRNIIQMCYNPNLRYKRKTELDFNGKLILKESTLFSTPNVINYNQCSLHNYNINCSKIDKIFALQINENKLVTTFVYPPIVSIKFYDLNTRSSKILGIN